MPLEYELHNDMISRHDNFFLLAISTVQAVHRNGDFEMIPGELGSFTVCVNDGQDQSVEIILLVH